jgi:transcriptional regulator with XRE-family HTH domain
MEQQTFNEAKIVNSLIFAIGRKIRELRNEKKLTLADLAGKINVSPSLISQLERGGINPSISLLKSISDALEIPLALLLEEEESHTERPSPIVKSKERKVIVWEGGIRFALLSRTLDLEYEFIYNEWPPGSSTGKEKYVHDGVESGILLEGEMEVELGDQVHHLKPGDSITFRCDVPHRLSNRGKKTAKGVWINSKPWIFSIR